MVGSQPRLKSALSHVLWIGGSIGAGKTSVARLLADRYALQVYQYDRDALLSESDLHDARRLGLKVIEVNGSLSLDAVAAAVERHLGQHLSSIPEPDR